jgi:hypothetical protein
MHEEGKEANGGDWEHNLGGMRVILTFAIRCSYCFSVLFSLVVCSSHLISSLSSHLSLCHPFFSLVHTAALVGWLCSLWCVLVVVGLCRFKFGSLNRSLSLSRARTVYTLTSVCFVMELLTRFTEYTESFQYVPQEVCG